MITGAETGRIAWDTLAATYASANTTNVMRLEDAFGIARKSNDQSMPQWIANMKSLVSQLRGVSVIIDPNKVTNRMLYGRDSTHDPMKYDLQACSINLTIEIVIEHLLVWEQKNLSLTAPQHTVHNVATPYRIIQMATQKNSDRGPMATALTTTTVTNFSTTNVSPVNSAYLNQTTNICSCNCCDHNHHAGAARSQASHSASSRFSCYPTLLLCHACGKYGHTHSGYWSRFPHPHPFWIPPPTSNHNASSDVVASSLPIPDNRPSPRPPLLIALITFFISLVSDTSGTPYQFPGLTHVLFLPLFLTHIPSWPPMNYVCSCKITTSVRLFMKVINQANGSLLAELVLTTAPSIISSPFFRRSL